MAETALSTYVQEVVLARLDPEVFATAKLDSGTWSMDEAKRFLAAHKRALKDPDAIAGIVEASGRQARQEFTPRFTSELASELPANAFVRNLAVGAAEAQGSLRSLAAAPVASGYSREMFDATQLLDAAAQEADTASSAPAWANAVLRGSTRSAVQALATSPLGGYGMIAGFAASEANESYKSAKDAGMDDTEARAHAAIAAAIEGGIAGVFQRTGMGGMEKFLGGKNQLARAGAKELLKQTGFAVLQEVPEEILTEVAHSVNRRFSGLDPTALSPENVAKTIAMTTAQTILTVGMSGAVKGVAAQPGLRRRDAAINDIADQYGADPEAIRAAWFKADEKSRNRKQWEQVFAREIDPFVRAAEEARAKQQSAREQARASQSAKEERQRARQQAAEARDEASREVDAFLASLSDEEFANAFHLNRAGRQANPDDMPQRLRDIYEAMQDASRRDNANQKEFARRFRQFRKDNPDWKPNPNFWDTNVAKPEDPAAELQRGMRDVLQNPRKYGIANPDDAEEFIANNTRFPPEFATLLRAKFPHQALTPDQRQAEKQRVKDKVVRTERGRMRVLGLTFDGRYELGNSKGESQTLTPKGIEAAGGFVDDAADYKEHQVVMAVLPGARSKLTRVRIEDYLGDGAYRVYWRGRGTKFNENSSEIYSGEVDEDQIQLTPAQQGAKRFREEIEALPEDQRKQVRADSRQFDALVRESIVLYPVEAGRAQSLSAREAAYEEGRRIKDARAKAAEFLGVDPDEIASPVGRAKHLPALRAWLEGPGRTKAAAIETEHAKRRVEVDAASPVQIARNQVDDRGLGHESEERVYGHELRDGDQVLHKGEWLVAEVDDEAGVIRLHDGRTLELDPEDAIPVLNGQIVGKDGEIRDPAQDEDASFDFSPPDAGEGGAPAGRGPRPGGSPEPVAAVPSGQSGADTKTASGARVQNAPPEAKVQPPPAEGKPSAETPYDDLVRATYRGTAAKRAVNDMGALSPVPRLVFAYATDTELPFSPDSVRAWVVATHSVPPHLANVPGVAKNTAETQEKAVAAILRFGALIRLDAQASRELTRRAAAAQKQPEPAPAAEGKPNADEQDKDAALREREAVIERQRRELEAERRRIDADRAAEWQALDEEARMNVFGRAGWLDEKGNPKPLATDLMAREWDAIPPDVQARIRAAMADLAAVRDRTAAVRAKTEEAEARIAAADSEEALSAIEAELRAARSGPVGMWVWNEVQGTIAARRRALQAAPPPAAEGKPNADEQAVASPSGEEVADAGRALSAMPGNGAKPGPKGWGEFLVANGLLYEGSVGKKTFQHTLREVIPNGRWLQVGEVIDRYMQKPGAGDRRSAAKPIARIVGEWADAGVLDRMWDAEGNPHYAWTGAEPLPGMLTKEQVDAIEAAGSPAPQNIEQLDDAQFDALFDQAVEAEAAEQAAPGIPDLDPRQAATVLEVERKAAPANWQGDAARATQFLNALAAAGVPGMDGGLRSADAARTTQWITDLLAKARGVAAAAQRSAAEADLDARRKRRVELKARPESIRFDASSDRTNRDYDALLMKKPEPTMAQLDKAEAILAAWVQREAEKVAKAAQKPSPPPPAPDTSSPVRDRAAAIADPASKMPAWARSQAAKLRDALASGEKTPAEGEKELAALEAAVAKRTSRDVAETPKAQPGLFGPEDGGPEEDLFNRRRKPPIPRQPKPQAEPTVSAEDAARERTAAEALRDAARHGVKGLDDVARALYDLFGGNTVGAGPRLDRDTYEKAKPIFQRAYDEFRAAGADLAAFFRWIVKHWGTNVREYLRAFRDDLAGRLDPAIFNSEADNADDADHSGQNPPRGEAEALPRNGARRGGAGADAGDLGAGAPGDAGGAAAPQGGQAAGQTGRGAGVRGDGRQLEPGNDPAGRPGGGGEGVEPGPGDGGEAGGGAGGAAGQDRTGGETPPPGDGVGSPDVQPNYRIRDPKAIVAGGQKTRFGRNRKAIETFLAVQEAGRPATEAERDALANFTGWGSFGQELFDGSWDAPKPREGWEREDEWLRAHLGEEAWKSAQRSILNAHYTDPDTVVAMWDMIRRLGFAGGRVLEPAMGIGNFFGLMPADIAAKSDLTGIELDEATGGMAKMLYPQANIAIKGYQDSRTPDNFYDIVVGNWPFAADGPADRRYNKLSPSLHDYFFLKTLDQVRPGGLVVGLTSSGTMDKAGQQVRLEMARKAELVASFRLPAGTFQKYAGTKVVTDILVLRKRPAGQAMLQIPSWIRTAEVDTPAGPKVRVNQYYVENPRHVLGTLDWGRGTTNGRPGMIVELPRDFAARLQAAVRGLPEGLYQPDDGGRKESYVTNNEADRVNSVMADAKGTLWISLGEQKVRFEDRFKIAVKSATQTAERRAEIRALVAIRRILGSLYDQQRDNDEAMETTRADLRAKYRAFVRAHGPVSDSFALKMLRKASDPHAPQLAALERNLAAPGEKPRYAEATILSRSTTRPRPRPDSLSVEDAYVFQRNEALRLDMARVAELARTTEDAAAEKLLAANAVFRSPAGTWEHADEYLAGNVRLKLNEARQAKEEGIEGMERNIAALEKVQPADIPYFNIEAKLGNNWTPPEVYALFVASMIGRDGDTTGIDVRFSPRGWKVFLHPGLKNTPEALSNFGLQELDFDKLVEHAMRSTPAVVRYYDDETKSLQVDDEGSAKANEKVAIIQEHFSTWVWQDANRRVELERTYNDTYNNAALPTYSGDFLAFEGMMLSKGERPFDLRAHQVSAIARGLITGRGIYAHEVGTGKTYTMAGIAVESRRYGRAKKPLLFAHNANSATVAAEINEMYPGAKVLYVDNMGKDNRAVLLAQIANDDWDAIVVPHSMADRFALRRETYDALAAEQIAELEAAAIEAAANDNADFDPAWMDDEEEMKKVRSPTAKDLVRARNRVISRIQKMAQKAAEDAVFLEDAGIDMILVDEAHEFKKPPIATTMRMKGLNTAASDRSINLMFMLQYVNGINNGRGVHLFTGTPITNTLNELYNMMRFVMPQEMKADGIDHWDAWFHTFAAESTDVEVTPAGDYEPVSRLAAFVNVPELRLVAGQFMDTVFADDMPEFSPRRTPSGKTMDSPDLTEKERDFLLNGRTEDAVGRPYVAVRTEVAPMTAAQRAIREELMARAQAFRNMSKKERRLVMLRGGDESPLRVESDAAKAGLDARLYDMDAPDEPDSKVNRMVRSVLQTYGEHAQACQAIFMEQGYNDYATRTETVTHVDGSRDKRKYRVPTFNLAKDIVGKLVAGGIPEEQIAVVDGSVSKERRKAIADAMNRAEIRVVIGSTQTLGTGVNMQENLRALHHLDCPWRPGDFEQRNGRANRQGNKWNTVFESRHVTEGIDGRRWQVVVVKDKFIRDFLRSKGDQRIIEGDAADMEDEGGNDLLATLSEATGDPRILQIEKARKDLEKLQRRQRLHSQGIYENGQMIERSRNLLAELERDLAYQQAVAAQLLATADAPFEAKIQGKTYKVRKQAEEVLAKASEGWPKYKDAGMIGEYRGFSLVGYRTQPNWYSDETKPGLAAIHPDFPDAKVDWISASNGTLAGLDAVFRHHGKRIEETRVSIERGIGSIERLTATLDEPFPQQDKLERTRKRLENIENDLSLNPVPPPAWLRQPTPLGSAVFYEGRERTVAAHKWSDKGWFVMLEAETPGEPDVEAPYERILDGQGIPVYEPREFEPPTINAAPDGTPAPQAVRYSVPASELLEERNLSPAQTLDALRKAFPRAAVTIEGENFRVRLGNGKQFVAELPDEIDIDPEAFRKTYGRRLRDSDRAAGAWFGQAHIVQFARLADTGDVFHEAWHIAKDLSDISDEEDAVLREKFGNDEAQARAYPKWIGDTSTPWGRVFAKIRQFFRRLARALGLRPKGDWEAIFERVRSGRAFDRQAASAVRRSEAAPARYEQTQTAEAKARDAAHAKAEAEGDTETAQRLVDEAAKTAGYNPVPMFHGTAKDFVEQQGDSRAARQQAQVLEQQLQDLKEERSKLFWEIDSEEKADLGAVPQPPEGEQDKYWYRTQKVRKLTGDDLAKRLSFDRRLDDYRKREREWKDLRHAFLDPLDARIEELRAALAPLRNLANKTSGRPAGQVFDTDPATHATDAGYVARGTTFTPDRNDAERYAGTDGKVYQVYLRMDRPYRLGVDFDEAVEKEVAAKQEMKLGHFSPWERTGELRLEIAASALRDALERRGYDGVVRRLADNGGRTATFQSDEYVIFHPSQIKSADPFTYDDQGNLIPLSARFNPREQDIRYSVPSEDDRNQLRNFADSAWDGLRNLVGTDPDKGLRYGLRKWMMWGEGVAGRNPGLNRMEQRRKGAMETDTHALHRHMKKYRQALKALDQLVRKGKADPADRDALTAIMYGYEPIEDIPRPTHPVAAAAYDSTVALRAMIDARSRDIHDRMGDVIPPGLAAVIEENQGRYVLRAYRKFVEPKYVPSKQARRAMEESIADAIMERLDQASAKMEDAISRYYQRPDLRQALREYVLTGDAALLEGQSKTFQNHARRLRRYFDLLAKRMNDVLSISQNEAGLAMEIPAGALRAMAAGTAEWLRIKDTPLANAIPGRGSPQWKTIRKSFQRRKDLAKVLRTFYGEITDLAAVAQMTLARQNQVLAADHFQRELLAWQDTLPTDHADKFLYRTQWVSKDGRHFAFPLHDTSLGVIGKSAMWTDRATYELLQQVDDLHNTPLVRIYMTVLTAGRYMHTVANPPTIMRNFLTNFLQAAADGEFFHRTSYWKGWGQGIRAMWTNSEELEHWISTGVISASARSAELKANLAEAFGDPTELTPDNILQGLRNLIAKGGRALTAIYAFGDNIHKLVSVYSKMNRGMSEEEAIRRTRSAYPYYDMAPLAITKVARRLPVGPDFVTFGVEVMRNIVNNYRNAMADARKGSLHAMAGTLSVHGLVAIGGTTALGAMLAFALASLTDDDWQPIEEDEQWRLRRLQADYSRNANHVFVKDADGEIHDLELEYISPYSLITTTANILRTPGTAGEKGREFGRFLWRQFGGFPMAVDAAAQIVANHDPRAGRPVYLATDDAPTVAAKSLEHFASRVLLPSSGRRVKRAFEVLRTDEGKMEMPSGEVLTFGSEMAKAMTPLRIQKLSPEAMFRARMAELSRALREARMEESATRGRVGRGTASWGTWEEATADLDSATGKIAIEASELVLAAEAYLPLGTPDRRQEDTEPGSIRRILLDVGFSRQDAEDIVLRMLEYREKLPIEQE